MMQTNLPFGTQSAKEVRESSTNSTHAASDLTMLSDLLDILGQDPPPEFPMLRTTCSRLSDFLSKPIDQITLDIVNDTRDGFRDFLKSQPYKRNSIRTYINHRRILLNRAETFGWKPNVLVPKEWSAVLALATKKQCADIVRDFSRISNNPREITLDDVDDWIQRKIQRGASYAYTYAKRTSFWRLLRDCHCTDQTLTCSLREDHYGVSLDLFPPGLKNEVEILLKWKQAEFAANRPKGGRHRKVTSKLLQNVISGLYGYAINIRGESGITSLIELVQEQIISSYLEWRINDRKVKGYGLQSNMRLLSAAMRQHPSYKSIDFGWFKPLLSSIPIEPKAELRRRKAKKYLEYAVVEAIPSKILAERRAPRKNGIGLQALLTMEALMMKWIITLLWRQRNVRECRITGQTPNLFKAKIPPFSDIDKPEWVKQQEQLNPAVEFWQFRFSTDETKTEIDVHALVPRQLIGLLDEYLSQFRPHLLHGADPGTLFVNNVGKAMDSDCLRRSVAKLTMRYGGRRVTPHLFRDIVAYTWLKAHADDYLTLSKMLWHKNVKETIETYGGRFNESSGVCAMETWLEKREAKS